MTATRNVDKQKKNAIILQAHMDMVGVSTHRDPELAKKNINDPTKPIELRIDGDMLKANDRTLGADDGIGLATALSIAEDPRYKDMPLEIIFTTDEETGMYGAEALKANDFYGKYLVNLDSEESDQIIKGCASVAKYEEKQDISAVSVGSGDYKKVTIEMKDANGGHSGCDIHKGYINPIRTVLSTLNDTKDIKLVSVNGGEKFNSIPKSVKAEILVPEKDAAKVVDQLNEKLNKQKQAYAKAEPNLKVSVNLDNVPVSPDTNVVDPNFQEKLLRILGKEAQFGLISKYDDGNSKTSQNLGILNLQDGKLELAVSSRSSDEAEKESLKSEIKSQLCQLLDRKDISPNESPIWQPKEKSMLSDMAVESYKKLNNNEAPVVTITHGGLENAVFADKMPGLEQISIGPDVYEPHSTQERVKISSVDKFYSFVDDLLARVKNKINTEK